MRRLKHTIIKNSAISVKKIVVDDNDDSDNGSNDDTNSNNNGEKFDARKFHDDVAGLDDVDNDYYNHDDNHDNDGASDTRKFLGSSAEFIDADDYDDEEFHGVRFHRASHNYESVIAVIIQANILNINQYINKYIQYFHCQQKSKKMGKPKYTKEDSLIMSNFWVALCQV